MRTPLHAVAMLLASAAVPALAQEMDHGHMDHDHMSMPAGEGRPTGQGAVQEQPADDNPHAGHAMRAGEASIPMGSAPTPPNDHAAEAFYDPAAMARARAAMLKENGGMTYSQVMLEQLEYRVAKGDDGYHWEGGGWIGGDVHRLALKSEGEGMIGGALKRAEVQALYSRAIDPWFNLQTGVRHDIRPVPRRTYAVIGIEGIAPYWFEVEAHAFLSNRGEAHLRFKASYDQRITQRLILQPSAEVNIAAQGVPSLGIGSGVSGAELGVRLRYEFAREFAPYVGVNWESGVGDTARLARAKGRDASTASFVMGVRFWF